MPRLQPLDTDYSCLSSIPFRCPAFVFRNCPAQGFETLQTYEHSAMRYQCGYAASAVLSVCMSILLSTLLISTLLMSTGVAAFEFGELLDDKALYGKDDRYELVEASETIKAAAGSVGALVARTSLLELGQDKWELQSSQTGRTQGWCENERFIDQPNAASCTGFLVAADQIATSAHCVQPADDPGAPGLSCANLSVVFGYALSDSGQVLDQFSHDSVFHCKRVLAGENDPTGSDWRVFELERAAQHIRRLTVYKGVEIQRHWPLSIVGYPNGLPAKYGNNANIVDTSPEGYFVTDIDSYVGNSGSPVFVETDTDAIVVGLLSRGAADYLETSRGSESCLQSRQCTSDTCGGEHVTPSSVLARYAEKTLDNITLP